LGIVFFLSILLSTNCKALGGGVYAPKAWLKPL
jgi:hypothetical protein